MTLAGFLPPIPHHEDRSLLLDGGYVNNVPADVMHKRFGVRKVIAVNVGTPNETEYYDYGMPTATKALLFIEVRR